MPVQVLVFVAIAGAFANIVGSIASMINAVVQARRLESQLHPTKELVKVIARHVGISDDTIAATMAQPPPPPRLSRRRLRGHPPPPPPPPPP